MCNAADHNYLKAEELACVARLLQVPLAQVYSVATFYAFFNLTPQGEHVITVCRGRPATPRFQAASGQGPLPLGHQIRP